MFLSIQYQQRFKHMHVYRLPTNKKKSELKESQEYDNNTDTITI